MPYLPQHLSFALTDAEQRFQDKDLEMIFRRRKIADLTVTSPSIVACDPLACPEMPPFQQAIPTGIFPVHLSIVHIKTDRRVAFAALTFRDEPVRRWEMAVNRGQDVAKLKPGHYYGYPVDAGTGCFMDADTNAELLRRMEEENEYYQVMIDELDKTQVNTWAWADIRPSNNSQRNLVIFSTGYGDGMYGSYFGFGSNNQPVCLVTDFGLIPEEVPVEAPQKKSWMFWKK